MTLLRRLFIVTASLSSLGLLALAPHLCAAQQLTLQVGLYENEPKIYTDQNGEPAGLFVELLDAMAAEEDWQLQYRRCEWAQCLDQLQTGELDLMPDVAFTADRNERMDFHSVAVTQSWSQLLTRRFESIRHYHDLAGQRIAILTSSVQEGVLMTLLSERQIDYTTVPVDSLAAAFAAVQAGDAEVAVANNFFARRHALTYDLMETPITFNQVGLFYATASGRHPTVLDAIDQHLMNWQADADSLYYQALRRATTRPAATAIPGWLLTSLSITAACLLAMLLLVGLLRWTVKQRTLALQTANQRLEHVINGSPAVIYSLHSENLEPLWVSNNVQRIFGFKPSATTTPGWWRRHLHPDDRINALRTSEQIFQRGHIQHEYRIFDAQGKVRYVRDEMQLVTDKSGQHQEIIGTWVDQTESQEQQAQLSYLTHYDPMTGLPNRMLLHQRLTEAIHQGAANQYPFALLCIDLDRFKNINDSLGPSNGDEVLGLVVEKLRKLLIPGETLARTGADEFCMLIPNHADQAAGDKFEQQKVKHRIQAIMQTMQEPLMVAEQSLILTASVGVCRFPKDGETPEQLMTSSELAMFAAKKQGGDCWQEYYPQLSKITEENFLLENALRHAIVNNELLLHYQPQFNLQTGKLVGVEALVRWHHPKQGMISPGQFIPLAEEIGIIADIDQWVLETACAQLLDWDSKGLYVPQVAVNLSVVELESSKLLTRVTDTLAATGLAASRLELEITESMLLRAPDAAVALLNQLSDLGVTLAMDDFGTGYSNLSHLGSLPIHSLKIDQSFVRNIGNAPHNESIVRAIVALANALQLHIIAEGIEEPEQQEFLLRAGCATGQGFLLGRPMAIAQFWERFGNDDSTTGQQKTASY